MLTIFKTHWVQNSPRLQLILKNEQEEEPILSTKQNDSPYSPDRRNRYFYYVIDLSSEITAGLRSSPAVISLVLRGNLQRDLYICKASCAHARAYKPLDKYLIESRTDVVAVARCSRSCAQDLGIRFFVARICPLLRACCI